MAQGPLFKYDANLLQPGVDLTLTGVGTPNLTASYGDYGGRNEPATGKRASCRITINYTDIQYTINEDNSITVTGRINGAILTRSYVADSTNRQELTAWFNNQQTFHTIVDTASSGTYDLNIPDTFSVTIPPSNNPQYQWPAAIHFLNRNTQITSTQHPDEFNLGIGILNPNPPDYRPGKVLDNGDKWQSHNRSAGASNILDADATTWKTMRTVNGGESANDPPHIMDNNRMVNMRKIGENA